ncbi:MAG: hypothetical protein U9N01_02355 [Euryarchaeota archaeon]|nr:hypothetical protein [Euryarchaeota archaeon]
MHKKSPPMAVATFACISIISLSLLLSLATPALASDVVYGPGKSIMAVICVEAGGDYKDFVPHYNDHFPPGSTVKIYVEASGKTTMDNVTGEYKPSIQFKMDGTRPTGATFSASTSSSKMINHDSTLYKETYGVISFSVSEDVAIGDYRFRIEATDSNKGGERIGRTPFMHFYVYENATLYPPINYTYSNLTVAPNPAVVGTTVRVTVNVTNSGGKGNWKGETVYLSLNDTEEVKATNTLKLANDENTTATFRLTKKVLGEVPAAFNVSIGGLNETLIIKEKPLPTATPNIAGRIKEVKPDVPGFTVLSAIAAFSFAIMYRHLSRKRRDEK